LRLDIVEINPWRRFTIPTHPSFFDHNAQPRFK
jgi:hypothetical protein